MANQETDIKPWYFRLLRFLGTVLLIDLAIFAVVSLTCLLGTRCTAAAWSNRMFWAAMIAAITAMPAIIAGMSTGSGVEASAFDGAWANERALPTIQSERRRMSKRLRYLIRQLAIAAGALGISALIDLLTR
jgi:hypothetical protein